MAESLVMSLLQYFKKTSTAKDSNTNNDNETDRQMQNVDVENCNDNVKQQKIQAFVSKIGESESISHCPLPHKNVENGKTTMLSMAFFPKSEQSNLYPTAQCLLCLVEYANSNLVPSKLLSHLKNQHPEHEHKSQKFFQSKLVLVFFLVLFAIFILHSRESELYRYIFDGKSALAWELPFSRFMGHLSAT